MKSIKDHGSAATGADAKRRASVSVILIPRMVVLTCLIVLHIIDTGNAVPARQRYQVKNVNSDQKTNEFHRVKIYGDQDSK
jgi:hypothetical protein